MHKSHLSHPLSDRETRLRLVLGTGRLGLDEEFDDAVRRIQAAIEYGFRIIDTAPSYGEGRAETILGYALGLLDNSSDVRVNTKIEPSCLTARDVRKSVVTSLKRLGVERIDTLFWHWIQPRADVPALAAEFKALKDDGLIRNLGVCNAAVGELTALSNEGITFDSLQNPFWLPSLPNLPRTLAQSKAQGIENFQLYGLSSTLLASRKNFELREHFEALSERFGLSSNQILTTCILNTYDIDSILVESQSLERLTQYLEVATTEYEHFELLPKTDSGGAGLRNVDIGELMVETESGVQSLTNVIDSYQESGPSFDPSPEELSKWFRHSRDWLPVPVRQLSPRKYLLHGGLCRALALAKINAATEQIQCAVH